jgi:hypothetical protein
MTPFQRCILGMLACLPAIATPPFAQDQTARVVVPDGPAGGAFVDGCYRADRPLYGPYRVRLCFGEWGSGTYALQGPQLVCEGRLNWRASGGTLDVSLWRQSCNLGRAWAAAQVTCRPRGLLSAILDDLIREMAGQNAARPRVVVPDRPTFGRLDCTYHPSVAGTPRRQFFANRVVMEPRGCTDRRVRRAKPSAPAGSGCRWAA